MKERKDIKERLDELGIKWDICSKVFPVSKQQFYYRRITPEREYLINVFLDEIEQVIEKYREIATNGKKNKKKDKIN